MPTRELFVLVWVRTSLFCRLANKSTKCPKHIKHCFVFTSYYKAVNSTSMYENINVSFILLPNLLKLLHN